MALTKVQSEMAGAGQVIQVVNGTTFRTSNVSTSSSSYVSTGLSISITPKFATSKILLLFNTHVYSPQGANGILTIYRNSTNLAAGTSPGCLAATYNGNSDVLCPLSMSFLDSPATTSSTTYTVYFATAAGTLYLAGTTGSANSTTVAFTAMEIAG